MQIQNNTKNPSFGSTKLHNVVLKTPQVLGEWGKFNAYFSRLDKLDIPYITSQEAQWKGTKYGKRIIDNFKNMFSFNVLPKHNATQYFIIEGSKPLLKTEQPKGKEIYGMAQVVSYGNMFEISYIQSASKLGKYQNKVKGIGQMLLYGIVKEAKKQKKKLISLVSTADKFYKHSGWRNTNVSQFELRAKDYDAFLEDMEYKYKF